MVVPSRPTAGAAPKQRVAEAPNRKLKYHSDDLSSNLREKTAHARPRALLAAMPCRSNGQTQDPGASIASPRSAEV